jgi:hypothetical protein
MSRAYRISVRESLNRKITGKDSIQTQLEVLEVLPCEQMAGLLAEELKKHGFEEKDGVLVREQNGVKVSIDPGTGVVTVQVETEQKVKIEREKEGRAYAETGPSADSAKKHLRAELKQEMERQAKAEEAKLQAQVTDRLEAELAGLKQELDQVVNRVTAEALKVKAAQMGQIKEMTEDPQTGSLTIVVEV